jgi:hypothetical protein
VPTSWKVSTNPPELHQNHWQLLAGNSFFLAMLMFLTGVGIMLMGRSNASVPEPLPRPSVADPPACGERLLTPKIGGHDETAVEEGSADRVAIGPGPGDQ